MEIQENLVREIDDSIDAVVVVISRGDKLHGDRPA